MTKENKKLYLILIILNIILIAFLITSIVFHSNLATGLLWLVAPLTTLVNVYLVKNFSIRGLNIDKEDSNMINRSFDDTTTIASVVYILIYLIIVFLEQVKGNILSLKLVQISFCIITIIFEIIISASIFSAKKETKKLIEKKYNTKK